MDKYGAYCFRGECLRGESSGLNHGPKSREHEDRFSKRDKPESRMMKDNTAMMINSAYTRNRAN